MKPGKEDPLLSNIMCGCRSKAPREQKGRGKAPKRLLPLPVCLSFYTFLPQSHPPLSAGIYSPALGLLDIGVVLSPVMG